MIKSKGLTKIKETIPMKIHGFGVVKVRVVQEDDYVFNTFELSEDQLEELGVNISFCGRRSSQDGKYSGNACVVVENYISRQMAIRGTDY